MAGADDRYDIRGIRGAEIFRDLPEGMVLELSDGAKGEIVGNARDGAVVLVKIIEDPHSAGRVGQEEAVFYREVVRVLAEDGDD